MSFPLRNIRLIARIRTEPLANAHTPHNILTAKKLIPQSTLGSVAKSPMGYHPGSQTHMGKGIKVVSLLSKQYPRPEHTPPGSPARGTQEDMVSIWTFSFEYFRGGDEL